ncbi:MAG: hypothetical protein Q7R30_08320 [Acidobacteriota bacterium]|nr:hypothetical protein [Acidobacteriota bacterium]
MTSAAEARFRIDRPNSRPRAITVIALDQPSERVVMDLAGRQWNRAAFFALRALTRAQLDDQIDSADLVVVVATAGEDARDAALIGEACSARRVQTTGLILGGIESADEALSTTLAELRPWMLMLVIASSAEYVEDMLRALRA